MKDLADLLSARFPVRPSATEGARDRLLGVVQARSVADLADAAEQFAVQCLGARQARLEIPTTPMPDRGDEARRVQIHVPPDGAACLTIPLADAAGRLHLEVSGGIEAVVGKLPAWCELVDVLDLRLAELLAASRLHQSLANAQRNADLQRALYAIADLAYADLDMREMLARVHAVIDGLTYAKNLFIATYDAERDVMRFIYYGDQGSAPILLKDDELAGTDYPNSLTLAMVRRGKSLMGPSAVLRAELDIALDPRLGPESADWLGVPMLEGDRVRGAVVVQSYDQDKRYTEEDRTLLSFVAQHVLVAVTRKQAQEQLEREVERRTAELAEANLVLRGEVHERERAAAAAIGAVPHRRPRQRPRQPGYVLRRRARRARRIARCPQFLHRAVVR